MVKIVFILLVALVLNSCGPDAPPDTPEDKAADAAPTPQMAGGETIVNDVAGIEFTIPKGWKAPKSDDGDGEFFLVSPDESLSVTFFVPDDENYEQATKDVVDDLAKFVKKVKITEQGQESTVNGLKTLSIAGSGVDADNETRRVEWDLTIIDAKKPVFVVSLATPENFPKNAPAYETLVQSVKPAN